MVTVGRLKDGDLLIKGVVDERGPSVKDGLVCHFPFDDTTNGINYNRNLLDVSSWVVGKKGTQGKFTLNGSSAENDVILYPNPWGDVEPTWASPQNDAASDADGGWNHFDTPIDKTKKYRLTVWIKRENPGNGRIYFGAQGNTVYNISANTVNTNPYFGSYLVSEVPQMDGNWTLWVAYIHPFDYTGATDPMSGIYDVNGVKLKALSDFKWSPTATHGGHRTYQFYSTATDEKVYWSHPRFEVCDGYEAPLSDLLKGVEETVSPSLIQNVSVSSNGIAVEGSTTNIASQTLSIYNNYGVPASLTKLKETYNGQPVYRLAMTVTDDKSQHLSHFRSSLQGHGVIVGNRAYSALTKYASSIFWRPVNKEDVVFGGTASNMGSWRTGKTEYFADGWRRYARFLDGTMATDKSDSIHHSFYCPSLELNETVYIDVCCPQTEQGRTFPTSYTDSTRGNGRIDIPFNLKPPYSINLWHKSLVPISEVTDQGASPMIFQLNGYHTNASISFWNFIKNLVVYIKGDTGSGWSTTRSYYPFNASNWDNVEHMYTLVAVNNRTFKVYVDGVYLGEQTSTVDVTNISYLSLGNTSMPNASYRDLSFYNKTLDDKEVQKLYGQTFNLDEKGNTITTIKEKPNSIPTNSLYIPLDLDSSDRFGTITPNSEANTIYEDGAVFVGLTPRGDLEYNLFRDYGLNWDGDWSIVYWKKPQGTNSGLTGYSIESLGSNGNTAGGGYCWFGKNTGSNTLKFSASALNSPVFVPGDYFNNWQMVSVVKKGSLITHTNWSRKIATFTASYTNNITKPNYFVTQYGYDLKLGGWDNVNSCDTWFRDLIVAKRAFTTEELNAIFATQMRAGRDILQLQGVIKEGVSTLG